MAVQVLYESELTETPAWQIAEKPDAVPDGGSLPEYADTLIKGVESHIAQIDQQLASVSENWSVDRMPITDRAIMRVAVYEIAYVEDVPVSVSINEAVELAKAFGAEDDSSRFINGVLGRIARKLEDEEFKGHTPPETLAIEAREAAAKREAEQKAAAERAAAEEKARAQEEAEHRAREREDGYGERDYDDYRDGGYDDYDDRSYRRYDDRDSYRD